MLPIAPHLICYPLPHLLMNGIPDSSHLGILSLQPLMFRPIAVASSSLSPSPAICIPTGQDSHCHFPNWSWRPGCLGLLGQSPQCGSGHGTSHLRIPVAFRRLLPCQLALSTSEASSQLPLPAPHIHDLLSATSPILSSLHSHVPCTSWPFLIATLWQLTHPPRMKPNCLFTWRQLWLFQYGEFLPPPNHPGPLIIISFISSVHCGYLWKAVGHHGHNFRPGTKSCLLHLLIMCLFTGWFPHL